MMTKRPLAALCLFLALCLMLAPCAVAADATTTYTNPEFGFTLQHPASMVFPTPEELAELGVAVEDEATQLVYAAYELDELEQDGLVLTVMVIPDDEDTTTSFSQMSEAEFGLYSAIYGAIFEEMLGVDSDGVSYVCENGKYITLSLNLNMGIGAAEMSMTADYYITIERGQMYIIMLISVGKNNYDATMQSIIDSITFTEPVTVYADVANHWAKDAILRSMQLGLFSGTSETTFSPNDNTTRAQLVTALYRLAGSPEVGEAPFSDVKADAWYANAVAWAAENGIAQGSDGKFRPNDPLTREQLATILCRFSAYQGNDVTAEDALAGYTDSGKISSWAAVEMNWAVAQGLITGVTETTLSPATYTTRAQLATILMRYLDAN